MFSSYANGILSIIMDMISWLVKKLRHVKIPAYVAFFLAVSGMYAVLHT